jgi:hypothetical protein
MSDPEPLVFKNHVQYGSPFNVSIKFKINPECAWILL